MKGLDIDVDGRTAWAETGLTAAEYTTAVAEHGLAIGFGDTGSVGIGGITLGGGVGYLVRKFGLTIDDLLAAEIVTADGQLLQVDADHHPDLFWAIRGGGGNFGVVTRFQYRLHELPGIVGGMLFLPATAGHRRRVHRGGRGGARRAVDDRQRHALPADAVRARRSTTASSSSWPSSTYAGDAEAGERAIAPFRALATPLADLLRPMPYPEIYPPEDPDYHPTAVARTMFIDRVDREVADAHHGPAAVVDASMRAAQLRVLGGAMARVPADATAFAHRASRIMVNVAAFYEGPDDQVVQRGVGDRLRRRPRAGRPRRLRQLRRRRRTPSASGPPIRARPGTGWRRSRPATTRPTCSASTRTCLRQRQARTPAEAAAADRRPPAAALRRARRRRLARPRPAIRARRRSSRSRRTRPITRLTPASR